MDGSSFDRLTRRLSVTSSRRAGIASLLAGALGIAGVSAADAARGAGRRHEKLACRNDQSECTASEQCCSGICRVKPGSGTGYRCVGNHKKKAKKDHKKDGGAATTCHGLDEPGCWPYGQVGGDCCADLYCEGHPTLNDTVCVECIDLGFFWSPLAPCCAGTVQGISNLVDVCCVASGQACSADSDCCGYNGSPGYTCQSGTCQQLQ